MDFGDIEYPQNPVAPNTAFLWGTGNARDEREDENVKRIISILLALIMALSLLPVSAMAVEPEGGEEVFAPQLAQPAQQGDEDKTVLQTVQPEEVAPLMAASPQSSDVAKVIDKDGNQVGTYTSFWWALSDAKNNPKSTLKLLSNLIYSSEIDGDFTLDGTGYTISRDNSVIFLKIGGNVKIIGGSFSDVSVSGNVMLAGGSYAMIGRGRAETWEQYLEPGYAFFDQNGNQLTDDKLKGERNAYLSNVIVKEEQTAPCQHPNITNGVCDDCSLEFVASTEKDKVTEWHAVLDPAMTTFRAGTLASPVALKLWQSISIGILHGVGTLDLNGKTLTITAGIGDSRLAEGGSPANITITGDGEIQGSNGQDINISWDSEVAILNGKFNGLCIEEKAGIVTLYGGTYGRLKVKGGKTLNDLLAQGCAYYTSDGTTPVDGNVSVLENIIVKGTFPQPVANPIARVGTIEYDNLTDAIADAVQNGRTVMLLQSITEDVTIDKAVKLNLNGKSITGTLTISNDSVRLTGTSGTIGTLKITVQGKTLLDVLPDGYAYADNSDTIIDGAKENLTDVKVVSHNCDFSNSNVCICGREKDTTAPVIALSDIHRQGIEDGKQFVEVKGGTLYFTVTDNKGVKSVYVNNSIVTAGADGRYNISIGNTGKKEVIITATDESGNSAIPQTLIVYQVVETRITSICEDVTVLEICGVPVDDDYPATDSRWVRASEKYSVKMQKNVGYKTSSIYLDIGNNEYRGPTATGGTLTIAFTDPVGKVSAAWQNLKLIRWPDETAPKVTMTVKDKAYTGFTQIFYGAGNKLVYGLFYKGPVTVNVTATDNNSGVIKAEYLFSRVPILTANDVKKDTSADWKEFAVDQVTDEGQFTINADNKGYLYVRVTDRDGNKTVVNPTAGLVIYTDATLYGDSEITKTRNELKNDLQLMIDPGSSTVEKIICKKSENGSEVKELLYAVVPNPADANRKCITLKKDALKDLEVGTYTLTVSFKDPLGVPYVTAEGNEAPTDCTVTLIVAKDKRTISIADDISTTYDGQPVTAPGHTLSAGTEGTQQVSFAYKVQGKDDNMYTTDAPKTVGSYTVRVTVAGHSDYADVSATRDFTISPRTVSIDGLTVKDKVYDGTTTAEIANTGTLTNVVPGDDVRFTIGKPTFEDKNVGKNITVNLAPAAALEGGDAVNYTLEQPAVTASITPRTLTLRDVKVADKPYDGTNTATLDGTPTLIGLVAGENLTLICGTPTFDSVNVGRKIPVSFTAFTISDGTGQGAGLASNYTLTQPTGITGNITISPLWRKNIGHGRRPSQPQLPTLTTTVDGKDNVTSARTGDMGIALYAALSLASLSGTAVIAGKRKENK